MHQKTKGIFCSQFTSVKFFYTCRIKWTKTPEILRYAYICINFFESKARMFSLSSSHNDILIICLWGKGYRLLIRGIKIRLPFATGLVVPSMYALCSLVHVTLSNLNFKNKSVHITYVFTVPSTKILSAQKSIHNYIAGCPFKTPVLQHEKSHVYAVLTSNLFLINAQLQHSHIII